MTARSDLFDHKQLTVLENKLYQALRAADGRVVTYERLCLAMWGEFDEAWKSNLRTHTVRLRAKGIDIGTSSGVGYRLRVSAVCGLCGQQL